MDSMMIALDGPEGEKLTALKRAQLEASVRAITEALDKLPVDYDMRIVFMALAYVRNGVLLALQENQRATGDKVDGRGDGGAG